MIRRPVDFRALNEARSSRPRERVVGPDHGPVLVVGGSGPVASGKSTLASHLAERLEQMAAEFGQSAGVADIVAFVRAKSARALCQPNTEGR